MPTTASATCSRCDGTGQYNGTRRDGSSYVGSCFACQGYQPNRAAYRRAFRSVAPVAVPAVIPGPLPQGIVPNVALGLARGDAALVAFAAAHPAEYGWLVQSQAAGVAFAVSLLAGIKRYGNLTPRQLAAVQRNLPAEDSAAAGRVVMVAEEHGVRLVTRPDPVIDMGAIGRAVTPLPESRAMLAAIPTPPAPVAAPVIIEADPVRRALNAAAASGLRKVRLDLGAVTFKRTGASFRNGGEGLILCYHSGSYKGLIRRDNTFHRAPGREVSPEQMAAFTLAANDPEAAARAHGADTTRCSCCRRTLTDPVSVMQGIGPVCIERFGWRLR